MKPFRCILGFHDNEWTHFCMDVFLKWHFIEECKICKQKFIRTVGFDVKIEKINDSCLDLLKKIMFVLPVRNKRW